MAETESKASEDEERIRPFYCGSQYGDWTSANCERQARKI